MLDAFRFLVSAPANTFLFKFPYKTIIVKKSEISDSFFTKTTCVIERILKNYIINTLSWLLI